MADMRVLVGDPAYYNLLARAALTSSGSDPLFPIGNLADGIPGTIQKYSAIGTDRYGGGDFQQIPNGDFEAAFSGGHVPDGGWISISLGAGNTTRDTAIVYGGSLGSLKCSVGAGGGTGGAAYTITVRAGEKFHLELYTRAGNVNNPTAKVSVYNKRTGKYLQPNGSWSKAATILFSETGTVFVLKSIEAQVEDYATCRADTVPLQVQLYTTSVSGDAYFENVGYWPAVNFAGVFGHNMEPSLLFRVSGSDDGVNYSPVHIGITPRDPSFWAFNAEEYHRFWRWIDLGTPSSEAGWKGEVILAQTNTAANHPRMGYETQFTRRLVQNTSRGGEVRSFKESLFEERAVRFSFGMTDARYAELRDEWFKRSDGGHFPMVVAPLDTETDVIHGRIDNSLSVRRSFINYREGDVLITESPFPSVVA